MLALLCLATSGAWAAYYAWSGGGSSPFYFDDTANWGFKTYGGGMWIAVPAIGSRGENINIDPTLLVNDGKGNGTTETFEGKTVSGVAYDVGWNGSFPASWNKTITFRNTTSLSAPIYLNYSGETVSFVATNASYGLTSSNQLWVRSGSTLRIESGTYTFASGVLVQGSLTVTNAMLKNTDQYLHIGDGGNGTVTIGPGGVYENFGGLGSLTVAHTSGNSGTLNVAGGTVSISRTLYMCYNASSASAAVNVTDGGVLTVKSLVLENAGTSGGVVTLDGGTLRAYADESTFVGAHESLRVYAGANGATFDSNGKTITIAESIEDKSGEEGVVRFTGGGTITLSGTPSYTGGTTIVAGTILSLTAEAKTALVAHPIAVEIPPAGVADGTTVLEINDGNGTFSQAEVDAIAVTGPYALVLADGGTKVVISATATLTDGNDLSALSAWAGKTCTVTYTRSFTSGKPSTVCLPFAYTPKSGETFYTFTGINEDGGNYTADMTEVVSPLVANTPYLFMPTGNADFSGTYAIPASIEAGTTTSGDWTFKGTYSTIEWTSAPAKPTYGFSAQDANDGITQGQFVKVGSYVRIKPMRAYMQYNGSDSQFTNARSLTRAAATTSDDTLPETIGVRLISANGEVNAIGTLYTRTGEVTLDGWYTLDGKRLSTQPTTKGIYVNNGKKVVIK